MAKARRIEAALTSSASKTCETPSNRREDLKKGLKKKIEDQAADAKRRRQHSLTDEDKEATNARPSRVKGWTMHDVQGYTRGKFCDRIQEREVQSILNIVNNASRGSSGSSSSHQPASSS